MIEIKIADHVYFIDQRLGRKYLFELDKSVKKEELTSYVSSRVKQKRMLAGFLPETLNFLYLRLANEIESEFNVHVKTYISDGHWNGV